MAWRERVGKGWRVCWREGGIKEHTPTMYDLAAVKQKEGEIENDERCESHGLINLDKSITDAFETFLTPEGSPKRKRRLRTLDMYRDTMARLMKFKVLRATGEMTEVFFNSWRDSREGSPTTISMDLRNMRTFARFCVRKRYLKSDPFLNVYIPKWVSNEKHLTRNELGALFWGSKKPLRRTLVFLLYSGLRPGAALNAQEDHLFGPLLILPTSKTSDNPDSIVLHPKALRAISRIRPQGEKRLFYYWKGDPKKLAKAMKKVTAPLGFDKVTPYTLRHSFGSHFMMSEAGDNKALQEAMTHKNLSTTMKYVHFSAAHRKKVIDRMRIV